MTRAKDISKILTDADISGTLDVSGAFTSQGIDDNADAVAITIDSSELVGIGTNSPSSFNGGANNLVVGTGSGSEGITIFADSSSNSAIFFADGDSTTTGQLNYQHASNAFTFHTNGGTERMRIDSSGNLLVGATSSNAGAFGSISPQILVAGTIPQVALHETDTDKDGYIGISSSTMFIQTADAIPIRFGTNDAERMRIDSSGNVGIGTTSISSSDKLSISGGRARIVNSVAQSGNTLDNSSFSGLIINNSNNANGDLAGIVMYPTSQYTAAAGVFGYRESQTAGGLSFWTGSNTGSERMRIEAGGNLLIGSTSYSSSSNNKMIEGNGGVFFARAVTSSAGQLTLANPNGNVGQIRTSGSTTTYATSSDYRLKDNINYTFDATSQIKQLKPCEFNFKTDLTTKIIGFIAHETQEIVPQAVSGTKDQVDADGNIDPQGIDNSHLVPLLVKTIQELESRITALEGA